MDTQTRNRPSLEVNTGYDEYDLPDGLPCFPPSSVKPLPTPLSSASLGRLPSLAPIAEQQAMATGRVGLSMSIDTPASMAEQTRSMLLSGMTASQATDLGTVANRRFSAPADMLQKQRRQSLLLTQPDTLQDWGHVYLGSATKADVFVAPSALRRPSSGGTGHGTPQGRPENHRVAIRARVRPRRKDRRPFVIARDFDLDQLRATIPDPTPPPSAQDGPGSARTPLSPLAASPLAGRGARRASMAASGLGMQPFQREGRAQQAGSKEFPIRRQSTLCRSCRTVLIIIVWSI